MVEENGTVTGFSPSSLLSPYQFLFRRIVHACVLSGGLYICSGLQPRVRVISYAVREIEK
jgi:hypothetical protein